METDIGNSIEIETSTESASWQQDCWIPKTEQFVITLKTKFGETNFRTPKGQTSMRPNKKQMVTAVHGHSRPQRSHHFLAGLLGRNSITDEGGNGPMAGKGGHVDWGVGLVEGRVEL
ncbi:hypothetical protein EVAR_94892_1 [Eumeta japonica]|uniref:Uncharacterized protein n=1 Tax=Eumeta variegata TaxID=151549 RepID=A0A4C1V9E6_EUMVA|nr:hypothetical protein EVAR_94892_1 [Eumeta japonica]